MRPHASRKRCGKRKACGGGFRDREGIRGLNNHENTETHRAYVLPKHATRKPNDCIQAGDAIRPPNNALPRLRHTILTWPEAPLSAPFDLENPVFQEKVPYWQK